MNVERKRLFKRSIAFGVACVILGTPKASQGWGAGGQMIVAQIAYGRLNSRARAQVKTLLTIPINPAAISAKSQDFVNAAHWADDLRPFPEFDSFKALHFIDTPFSTDGTPLPPVATPNIVTALQENVDVLRTSTDENAQAQALRFIIHLVADIHQPLHCATRVSSANPEGDRGGNLLLIQIRTKAGLKNTNLHSYWDSGLGTFPPTKPDFSPPPLSQIPAAAAKAKVANPATDPALKLNDPFNFQSWADESVALAKDVAYSGITKGGEPTAAYKRKTVKVANRRVVWAGYRLAALLNAIWQ